MNINDYVYVKHTPFGQSIADRKGTGREREGEWQLWRLMQVFGPVIYMGMFEQPFEKNQIELAQDRKTYRERALRAESRLDEITLAISGHLEDSKP